MQLPGRSESLWNASAHPMSHPVLRGDVSVDVAIVGGGITGLTAALRLVEEGRTVAVLEMRHVGAGETGQTTAHLTEIVDGRYTTIASDFGEEGAALVARSSREAIDWIERTVETLAIPCGFERVTGYLYSERGDQMELVRLEVESARRAGVEASFTREVPLPFRTLGALRAERQAQFHPRQYLSCVAEYVVSRGGRIFEGTRVESVQDGEPCLVEAQHGRVHAGAVIVATHVPMNRVALITKLPAYRSYALGVRLSGEAPHGLFWDTEDPYHYTRTYESAGGPVVIVGGADHKTGTDRETGDRFSALADYAMQRYPVARIDYRWSGQIIEPVDGLPYIGRNTASRHVYVATGYAGNGMTYGTLAGLLTSDLALRRSNPYADLFAATRIKPLAAATEYVTENVGFPAHLLKDRVASADVETGGLDAVPPGAGRIVIVDGRKCAVHRDESGEIHAFSPVCPHMGCDVAWNDGEASWDCPCHGSRFDAAGRVLNGPAVRPLTPVRVRQVVRRG